MLNKKMLHREAWLQKCTVTEMYGYRNRLNKKDWLKRCNLGMKFDKAKRLKTYFSEEV
jgi:hypothetical protein